MNKANWQHLSLGRLASWRTNQPRARWRRALLLALALGGLAPASSFANCGANGQPPCIAIPPCQTNLTVNPGTWKCYHPSCGKKNQGACVPTVRLQPCDKGLLPDPAQRMKCVAPSQTVAAKEIALLEKQGICRATIEALSVKPPAELQHIVADLENRVGAVQKAIGNSGAEKAAVSFIRRNAPAILEIGKAVRNIRAKAPQYRQLFTPDELCGTRTANQWLAKLKAQGFIPNLTAVKLTGDPREAGFVRTGYAASHKTWWLGFELAIEVKLARVRTVHGVTLLIALDGSKVVVLYNPYVGLGTPNLFGGGYGAVKLSWPSTLDEHLWVGGVGTIGLDPTAIVHLVEIAGALATEDPLPAIGLAFGGELGLDVVWDDAPHKLFKGHFVPGGLAGAISLGAELNPVPNPFPISAGIEGGVIIYQYPPE